jgi:hypothetical protein
MRENKTIIIAGDSWGCGEWAEERHHFGLGHYGISHVGLTKHLLEESGCHVINLSKPGGSNQNTSDSVSTFLQINQHLQISCIIVFQTEWTRDIVIHNPLVPHEDLQHGYLGLKNKLISGFYYCLSEISVKRNIPIHIVGGCSDTVWFDQFEKKHPGVQIVCQSLTNLVLENNHNISDPVHALFTKPTESRVEYIKKYLNHADLEFLLEDIDKGHQRYDQWHKEKEYFWPDGAHANRLGHEILYKFLKTQIPSL